MNGKGEENRLQKGSRRVEKEGEAKFCASQGESRRLIGTFQASVKGNSVFGDRARATPIKG